MTGLPDGIQAIDCFQKNLNNPFDLLITDIQLPGISGFEVIDQIKVIGIRLPILVITAYGDQNVLLEISRRKIDDYLTKPFSMDDLIQRIINLFDPKKHESQ